LRAQSNQQKADKFSALIHRVRNFYSVSISDYHIAEVGANPISQLAFTLSFFFSNGMDPEYTVLGRVAG